MNYKLISIILALILLVIGSFIAFNAISTHYYSKGANEVYTYFQEQLIKKALNCEPIPFLYQNVTYNLIEPRCLQQGVNK